ncbi:MAG: hypothetical protein AAFQ66_00120 [Pseudomonadota bacterium]
MSTTDIFREFATSPTSPAERIEAITPNNDNDLAYMTRALNVSGSGSVRVTTSTGDVGTVYIAAGSMFPIRVSRVWATGTTATGIQGLS